jgi:hypothetical protein
MLAAVLLALAAGDAAAPITLAPAPGTAPSASIVLGGHAITLDKEGRADVAPDTTLAAPGLRFYRPTEDGPTFYFPGNDTLVAWPLSGPESPTRAEIVVKAADATTWEHSPTFEAPVEVRNGKAGVRFVLSAGEWDVAVLVPGFAPAFSSKIGARAPVFTAVPSALKRAARLKARILSARTGKPPERWVAWVSRADASDEDDESRFFATRPIAADRTTLDFASIPVAAWELRVEIPGGGRKRQPFTVMKPGGVTDLGDFVIPDLGSVRLTLEFPVELPHGEVTIRVKGLSNATHSMDIDLGSRTIRPKAVTVVELGQIEPGYVSVECEGAASGIRHAEVVSVDPGATAEARFVFVPVKIHGLVKRGDDVVPGAIVSSPLEGRLQAISATSDDSGEYALRVWAASDSIFITTLAPGDETPFPEDVHVDPRATEVEHDVILPQAEIRGIVRDRETGIPVAGADVSVSTSPDKTGDAQGEIFAHASVASDREGRFRLRNLISRRVDVHVQHVGYASTDFYEIDVTPEGKELEVRLERGLRLHGIVTDQSGTPLAGVNVGMDPDARGLDFAREVTTSAAGEFEFRGTETGYHILEVMECGHRLEVKHAIVDDFEATPGEAEANIQLGPEPEVLRVHMQDDTGAPLDGWTLQWTIHSVTLPLGAWQQYATSCGHAVATDAEGNLELHGLPRETIGAVAPGTARPLGSFNNDGTQATWTIVIPKEQ